MEPLRDPLKNRVMKSIVPPPQKFLPTDMLFKNDKIQWSFLK